MNRYPFIHRFQQALLILLSLGLFSCERSLDIATFEDDFSTYEPELKIEGLLQQDQPEDSIVRIITSIAVTNTDIYNGIDDDGDGQVDERDEILPLVQDTSATVLVTNLNSGVTTEFVYVAEADSLIHLEDEASDGDDEVVIIPHGGYKPSSADFEVEPYAAYRLEVYSSAFDQTITGTTTVYPPPVFLDSLVVFEGPFVLMDVNTSNEIFWESDPAVSSYNLTVEAVNEMGNSGLDLDIIDTYVAARDADLSAQYSEASIGRTVLYYGEGVFQFTVESLSPSYGRYVFSELPLQDPQRSNLRDENGNPVMGAFGSTAARRVLVVIEGETD